MAKKKGLELSINFFVTLIIIIVIFSGSLFFIRNFFRAATQIGEQIDRDTEAQIRALFSGGGVIALPFNKHTIKRGKEEVYWLGILNIDETNEQYHVQVAFKDAFTPDEDFIVGYDREYIDDNWVLYSEGPYTIPLNLHKSIGVLVKVGDKMSADAITQRGTYVFNVCVSKDPVSDCASLPTTVGLYTGKVYKLFVEVP